MINSKIFIFLVFSIALGAGITLGRTWERCQAKGSSDKGPAFIKKELNLSDDQDVKMHAVWSKVMESHAQHRPRREAIQREKDAAIATVLSAEQQSKFKGIVQTFDSKQGDIEQERRNKRDTLQKERDEAVGAILAPDQKTRFTELVAEYDRKKQELEDEMKRIEDQAVAESYKILDDNQRKKFDEMRKARDEAMGKRPPAAP